MESLPPKTTKPTLMATHEAIGQECLSATVEPKQNTNIEELTTRLERLGAEKIVRTGDTFLSVKAQRSTLEEIAAIAFVTIKPKQALRMAKQAK